MDYITELEQYSADKELIFKDEHNPEYTIIRTKCNLPDNGDVKMYISVYTDYLQRVNAYVSIYVGPEHEVIRLIRDSKAKPANLYKQILKQLKERKAEIDEKISQLQRSYNYRQEAIENSKCFDNIPGVKKSDTETYGHYSTYGKLKSPNDSKNATLEFSDDKRQIANILKCLLDNGIIEPK